VTEEPEGIEMIKEIERIKGIEGINTIEEPQGTQEIK
jgi:hypothetical protein